jgi:uncharacterized protein YxeA
MKMKKIVLIIIGLFILIQFIRIDQNNPTIDQGKDFVSNQTIPSSIRTTVKQSCYDCHSNETKYPWYANVAPVSWWIKGHVNDARRAINFSEWDNYTNDEKARKLMNSVAYIKPDQMPLSSYVSQHPEAKLTAKNKKALINWMKDEAEKLNPNLKK